MLLLVGLTRRLVMHPIRLACLTMRVSNRPGALAESWQMYVSATIRAQCPALITVQMGFTDEKYPRIQALMGSHVRPNSVLTRTEEDEIVTRLLEDILSFSPKGTSATPSVMSKRTSVTPSHLNRQ